jgi:hypothetical protein
MGCKAIDITPIVIIGWIPAEEKKTISKVQPHAARVEKLVNGRSNVAV